MGRACKHENADHLKAGDFYDDAADACFGPYEAKCEQFRCLDCGAWLPLGSANDTPEVMVEIEAARLAADYTHNLDGQGPELPRGCDDFLLENDCPRCGWENWLQDAAEPRQGWHAGYLARCIATHPENS